MAAAEKELLDKQIPVLSIAAAGEKQTRVVGRKVALADKITFATQMEAAQRIQMGLQESLGLAIEMSGNKHFRAVIEALRKDIAGGKTLYDAMKATRVFDQLTLGLIRAGEQSGTMGRAFGQIKDIMTRNMLVRKKLISLMIYPLIVSVVAMGAIFVLMYNTIPVFVQMFQSAGLKLPLPTLILIKSSNIVTGYPWAVLAGMVMIVALMIKLPAFYEKCPFSHTFVLRLPLVGEIQRKLIAETFTRTLINLLEAELTMIDALGLCRNVSTCFEYKSAIARARLAVARGGSVMSSLKDDKNIFGLLIIRGIGFGEKTGQTELMLTPLSEELSRDILIYLEHMKTVIEPLMIIFVGGIVMMVLLAMFIPIFSLPLLIK